MIGSRSTTPRCTTVVLAAAVTLSAACAYQRAYVAYDDPKHGLPLAAAPFEGEALGVVKAAEGGPVWQDCTKVAKAAVWVLIDETRRLGGNAVGNIRWFPNEPGVTTDRPCCRQRWGWVLVWPVLATPAFQIAEVEGTAYRLAEPAREVDGMYHIPENADSQADLVTRIVSGATTGAR
jgi:hypothetical protein